MDKPQHFKTVHASVRPPRVAILVDKTDSDWQQTCLRIIEFYSKLWGGAYNIIIPTDGITIDETFWQILETFDPDYLYRYHKSGEDFFLNDPHSYSKVLKERVNAAIQAGMSDTANTESLIDKQLRDLELSDLEIMPKLQEEIKTRLAPFWFDDYAVDAGPVGAGSAPDFHLTQLSTIIQSTEHPDTISIVEAPKDIWPLWVGSVTGIMDPQAIKSFEQLGIGSDRFSFTDDNVNTLIELIVTGDIRAARAAHQDSATYNALPGTIPFKMSMLRLGLQRSTRYRYWQEPLVIVAGNKIEDFCLYYCLSKLRDRVVWVLPSITEKALGQHVDATSRAEMKFIFQISAAERSHKHAGGTSCISYSLNSEQVDGIIQQLTKPGARQYNKQIQKNGDVKSLIEFPVSVTERDNFQRDIPIQLSNDRSISPFSTPKPKHFNPIHPHEHRWITQLSIVSEAPPRHYQLGELVISDSRLTTFEMRVGKEGPAYFCPNVGYFGGDIDTVLIKPNLRLPPLDKLVIELAMKNGYECRPSDKGIYAGASISKWGSIEQMGNFLRNAKYHSVLDLFLDVSPSRAGQGVYLCSDRRRYLDLPALKALVGEDATTLIDELISKQILYRGFIFGCTDCRNADWFSVSDITQEFRCRRCGHSQIYTRHHWKQPEEPSWFYKLDELIYLGHKHGMAVSLLALDYLRKRSENNFTFTTDREFWPVGGSKSNVETDFFCVMDGVFTVGEAKTDNSLGSSASEEAAKITKYKHLVSALSVRQLVFATMRDVWKPKTVKAVQDAFKAVPSVKVLFLTAGELLIS